MNQLDQLKQYTTVVADTSDFETMRAYAPEDATTNPSLILKAVEKDAYKPLMQKTVAAHPKDPADALIDHLLVAFGLEILKIVPGRVSTEVDARLSFDVAGSIAKAHQLIALYKTEGIDPKRVLIKVASTWEGVRAAEALEREGIRCNMTLLFSMPQAIASAEAGATLISPFVGRITDWYKKAEGKDGYAPADECGQAGKNDRHDALNISGRLSSVRHDGCGTSRSLQMRRAKRARDRRRSSGAIHIHRTATALPEKLRIRWALQVS